MELKKCPFCGGKAELVEQFWGATYWAIVCGYCKASSPRKDFGREPRNSEGSDRYGYIYEPHTAQQIANLDMDIREHGENKEKLRQEVIVAWNQRDYGERMMCVHCNTLVTPSITWACYDCFPEKRTSNLTPDK